METNIRNNSCEHEGELVAYLYAESTPDERERFETHLLECTDCTDEFAEMSNARFSVFEWRREAFAHLPTPEIVIPYATAAAGSATRSRAFGWVVGLRQLVGLGSWPQAATAFGAALVLFGLGLGFVLIGYLNDGRVNVANNGSRDQVAVNRIGEDSVHKDRIETTASTAEPQKAPSVEDKKIRIAVRPRDTRADRGISYRSQKIALRRPSASPSLSGADDDVDNSLRLSDLFAVIGTIK